MGKLVDMFSQARRTQNSGGMGFLGKSKAETKPRAAALVVELPTIEAGTIESTLKAGADGLLFRWDGKNSDALAPLNDAAEAVKKDNESATYGLQLAGGWEALERTHFEEFKEAGIHYILLPLNAPARFLSMKVKDLELVVTVPMRDGELYPNFIRNLTAFDQIAAVQLDFKFDESLSDLSIEDILHYRAVREAVRFPAMLDIPEDLSDEGAHTLAALGVQAVVLQAGANADKTEEQIKHIRELLEQIFQEEKDKTHMMQS
ncbi:MAG TPA: hypothetical protein VFN23_06580 [Ktedonobacteraceae bacterium]|nr:hypothetical protein [Ktedonobacteraceae bacterium]